MNRRLNVLFAVASLFISPLAHSARHAPRFAYVANNQDDTVSIFSVHQAGLRAIGYTYTGSGSNPRAVAVTPSQAFLYVAEGNVGIGGYAVNSVNGNLTPVPGSPFMSGPEFSIVVHPSGKFLASVSGSAISTYTIDSATGTLTLVQTVSGGSPISAVFDPKGHFLFASNVNSNTVSVFTINQGTGTLTPVAGSPFPTGPNPQSLAIDAHGKFLYVPNGNGASISAYAINAATGALTEIPGSPFGCGSVPVAAVVKKSFLFVGNSADKTVSQYGINLTTGALTEIAAPFSTGDSGPLALTASPSEPLLYVADHDSDEVVVLGIKKAGVLFNEGLIRTRGAPLSIALVSGPTPVTNSPKFVYESNETSNDIWGYQASVRGTLQPLDGPPSAAGESPRSIVSDVDGAFVFAANEGSNNVSAFTINSQTGALVPVAGSPFPADMQPTAIAVDRGAHYVYVTNSGSNTISGFSLSSDGVLAPVPGSPYSTSGIGPEGLVIDPRGKFVYTANALSNTVSIFEIDAGTGALQDLGETNTGTLPVALAISRDGKYLFVLDQSSQNVSMYRIDPVTGLLEQVPGSPFGGAGVAYAMAVDPGGSHLYAGDGSTIIGYRVFDPSGSLHLLEQSPFSGVSGAYGLSLDLSGSFMYAANNLSNTVSGFQVAGDGNLSTLDDSPYAAGTNPASITVVSSFQ
jgi:6-phosphogluconolactonase